jgi:hypothetical protein
MASFDIKSELDSHEVTNAVDQANRVLQNRFDFKGTGAEFKMEDEDVLLTAKEEFQIHQMLPILNESITKRGIDIKTLKAGEIEIATGVARQSITLRQGIDKELAKKKLLLWSSNLKLKFRQPFKVIVLGSQEKKEMSYNKLFKLLRIKITICHFSL